MRKTNPKGWRRPAMVIWTALALAAPGGTALAVGRLACLDGPAQASRDEQKRAEGVGVPALFPFVGKERLAGEVLVEFLRQFDAQVGNDVFLSSSGLIILSCLRWPQQPMQV